SALLIAPTGAGKTLAGFLPTLVELSGASANLSPLAGRGRIARGASNPGEGVAESIVPTETPPHPSRQAAFAAPPSPRARGEGSSPLGRGIERSQGLHTLYISPLKAL